MICADQPSITCADRLTAPLGCTLSPACRRTLTRTRRSRRNKKCAALGCNGGWMMTTPPPSKTPPKTTANKPATGKRRLSRNPDNYPQSGAPLPPSIDGAEITLRTHGMILRGMDTESIAELARGLSYSLVLVWMLLGARAGFDGPLYEQAKKEINAAHQRGMGDVSEALIAEAKGKAAKEQAA